MSNSQFAIIMRGAPRAGKTAISKRLFENLKEKGVVLVQYDEIFKIKKKFEKNRIRFKIYYEIIKKLLKEGYSLILDYSFTYKKELSKVLKYIKKRGVKYRIYLLNPPFETLLERDRSSVEPKGEERLLEFYNSLLKNITPNSLIIDTSKLSEEESLKLILKDLEENDIV
ncbi:MAG: AAA family ATPase [Candidatus Hydrothermales bacterium]